MERNKKKMACKCFLDSLYVIYISWACLILKYKSNKSVIKPLQQFVNKETEVKISKMIWPEF